MSRRAAVTLLIVLSIAAAVAAPAAAQPLSNHDAAVQFSFAAYRARIAMLAQRPAIAERFNTLATDPRCDAGIAHAPKRARRRIAELAAIAIVDAIVVPVRPALDTFAADLERVQTTDRVLRSGRAAWAFVVSHFDQIPDLGDPCPAIQAWRRTGYDPKRAPGVPQAALQALSNRVGRTVKRKLDAAARRMQQLGVLRRDAHRFTGDPLFRGLTPDLQTSSGSGSSGPTPV